ncbi:hypothetical protein DdX_08953 [Ditylenchus destructor]|uniref:Uncharacterized protein n=1 Tax=Ditylenchus destructor TaxID=166010 RepID=A0AAD4N175_9BILA|nr:hypothetical protein DdX_08953 [Ditylenchus destructor]
MPGTSQGKSLAEKGRVGLRHSISEQNLAKPTSNVFCGTGQMNRKITEPTVGSAYTLSTGTSSNESPPNHNFSTGRMPTMFMNGPSAAIHPHSAGSQNPATVSLALHHMRNSALSNSTANINQQPRRPNSRIDLSAFPPAYFHPAAHAANCRR